MVMRRPELHAGARPWRQVARGLCSLGCGSEGQGPCVSTTLFTLYLSPQGPGSLSWAGFSRQQMWAMRPSSCGLCGDHRTGNWQQWVATSPEGP